MSEEKTKKEDTAEVADKTESVDATATTTTTDTPVNPVLARLAELGVPEEIANDIVYKLGAEKVEDLNGLTETDLLNIGMKVIPARNLLGALKADTHNSNMLVSALPRFDVLPNPPDDESWISALKTGGILKFNKDTVVGAISAALAYNVGLYDLPTRIIQAMEENAESLNEPVGAEFFEMQRLLTQRNYSEIFASLPGVTGNYATQGRKNSLLRKMEGLWQTLTAFHEITKGWWDSWNAGMNNPNVLLALLAGTQFGNGMNPAGMVTPPPTAGLRKSAETVIDSINTIFAGTGNPVAMALAYDAQQIRKALENPNLPTQVGAINREQMIKKLGVEVSSDYPLLEANLKRYALGVIELPNISGGQTELAYIAALYQLGNMIPWPQLMKFGGGTGTPTGIGGAKAVYRGTGMRD